jgi:hypothetical protein
MEFNLGSAAAGGMQGYLMTGNPWLAAAEAAISGFAGATTTAANMTGNIANGGMAGLNASSEAFQLFMYGQQIHHQEVMQMQSQAFDEMMDEKSEQMREVNTLRDVQMAQRKADNGITKKFIESITD